MHHTKKSRLAQILGLVIASIGAEAHAGFVTETAATPSQMPTDLKVTESVPAFNSALGALESVTLSFSDRVNLTGTLLNKSASAQNFNIAENVIFNVSFLGNQVLTDELSSSKAYSQIASGGTAKFGSYVLAGNSGTTTIIDPTILAQFAGTSPLAFDFTTLTQVAITGGGGNVHANFSTMGDAVLTVTYNYFSPNIVPEPASLAMTALGGLLVAAAGYARGRAGARARAARAC